ncbi:MAG: hypothetical protein HYZ11_04035 [Candidatus Tectomicrobia bacterium]|uniref:GspL periplasmic domain-containing protein n=1 Tax=Tectimicrobiota bacterium TaxID=2528274 RepID=A0A932HZQ1_UNCTE|nr:hypothetical protein [Candidatus Tectomicrobia bacterium]
MFRRIIGIELSGRSLHAAGIRWGWRQPALEGFLGLDLPPEEEGEDAWREAQDALRGWMAAQGGRPSLTVASLPGPEGFSAPLHFPFRRMSKARQVVKSAMEGEIPLTVEETLADFVPAPRTAPEGADVFAVAVPKTALARHLGRLERLGLFPDRVHYSPLAELEAARSLAPDLARGGLGVAHVEAGHATFLVAKDGLPVHLRTFRRKPFPDRPEEGGEEAVVRELQMALWSWQGSPKAGFEVERLVLAGAGGTEQLASALEGALNLPCRPLSLGPGSLLPADAAPPPDILMRIGAALGAGFSALNPLRTPFDLRQEELALRPGWEGLKRPAAAAAAAVLAFGTLGYADLALKVRREARRAAAAEQQVRAVFDEVFPQGTRIVDAQSQLAAQIQEQAVRLDFLTGGPGNGGDPLEAIAKVSRAIPATIKVRINRMEIDEMGLSLEGETYGFEGVDRIKSGLMLERGFERLEVKQARLIEGKQEVHFLMRIPFPGAPEERRR